MVTKKVSHVYLKMFMKYFLQHKVSVVEVILCYKNLENNDSFFN